MALGAFGFGEFELDLDRYQLLRRGFAVKLEGLPLQLLILLVRRRGTVVTRQEIEASLWGKDVFIDAEQGINTAIRKIRQVLRDHPQRPRYIQTVVGKGYRFLAADVIEYEAERNMVTMEELGQAIRAAAGLDG
jgi:DNA-binding winged helix-turn-helix (wHTH) protein